MALGIAAIATAVLVTKFDLIVQSVVGRTEAGPVFVVVLGLAFASVAMTGNLYFALAPGGSALRVGNDGVLVLYPNGRQRIIRWDEPRLRLRLLDFSSHEAEAVDYGSPYFLERHRGQWTALSREAFESILSAAVAQKLEVTSFVGFGGYGVPPLVRCIHPPGVRIRTWLGKPLPSHPT